MIREPLPEDVCTTELVWDDDQDATGVVLGAPSRGTALKVGPKAGWLPAHLVTVAAASCFMTTLLRLADSARVPVLGYVSIAKMQRRNREATPTIVLTPCIVVGSQEHSDVVRNLCQQAREASDVCRALEHRIQIAPDTQVIPPADLRPAL